MVPAGPFGFAVYLGGATMFAKPHDQRGIQHATRIQVLDQGWVGLIERWQQILL